MTHKAAKQVAAVLATVGKFSYERLAQDVFVVRRTDIELHKAVRRAKETHDIAPTHFHEREVRVIRPPDGDRAYMRCSCALYVRELELCVHIATVKQGRYDVFRD